MINKWTGFLVGLVMAITIAACGGSSASSGDTDTSHDGPTQAEFDALQTQVNQHEAAFEALAGSVNVVVSRDAAAATSKPGMTRAEKIGAAYLADPIDCSFSGHLPSDQFISDTIQCKTSSGYMLKLPWPDGGAPMPTTAWFETTNCMGTPYAAPDQFSAGARADGVVFTYSDAAGSYVGYMPAGGTTQTLNMQSIHYDGQCQPLSSPVSKDNLVEILPHDAAAKDITKAEDSYPALAIQ